MPNVEVLKQIERVLEGIPQEKLDMSDWSSECCSCGSTHCLAGWARLDPWMQDNTNICELFDARADPRNPNHFIVEPAGDGGWEAITGLADMCDIDVSDAERLFAWGTGVGDAIVPKVYVAQNIQNVADGKRAGDYADDYGVVESYDDDTDEEE